jgi:ABC-type transporter Mla subunit MlaD
MGFCPTAEVEHMADTQRIVDDIRTFVHASDQTCNDSLRALAAAYAAACKEANDRLRRCDEFLRQGLRSEAIRFAEAEPNLLDQLVASFTSPLQ